MDKTEIYCPSVHFLAKIFFMTIINSLLCLLIFGLSSQSFSEERSLLEGSQSSWKIAGEMVTIIRDPIEQISINQQCHPVHEKDCMVSKALQKYLAMPASEENLLVFQENPDIRPGKIVCETFTQGQVVLGQKPIRARFSQFDEFCLYGDGSVISIGSLGYYSGPQKVEIPQEETTENEASSLSP